jgi:uncharacterized membrane protein (UPF0127 family)
MKNENISFKELFSSGPPVVYIKEIPMIVEIVDTDETRARGLSGRTEIKTPGMLFVFDTVDYHEMWMKEMLFPIDIIWVDTSLTVVGVERGVRPDTYPTTFRSPVPVKYAIETEDRYTEAFGISVGDTVRLPRSLKENK